MLTTIVSPLNAAIDAIEAFAADKHDFALELAKARALMHGYDAAWRNEAWRAVPGTLESEFRLPIINPDTGCKTPIFTQGGKRDGLCTNDMIEAYRDGEFLLEHKTTGDKIDDPSAPYWQRLDIDAQVSLYSLAAWQEGRKLAGTLYDVIRKPGIDLTQIPLRDADGIKIVTDVHSNRVQNKNGTWKQTGDKEAGYTLQSREETPDEFEERLKQDTLDRPGFYFARKVIWRMDRELLEHAYELWQTAAEIREARLKGRHYRNSGACIAFNRPCEYLPLCSGRDTVDSGNWTKRNLHPELPNAEGDDKDLLTNSRIQCFKLCRRKHQYRYELGIGKVDKEESQALVFGSMLHEGLRAFWEKLL